MNSKDADRLGERILQRITDGDPDGGHALLAPYLERRTPFRLLDRIGMRIGAGPLKKTNSYLDALARGKAIGTWPLIGSALAAQLDRDFEGALARCRKLIILGDVWYAADTLAERMPGAALVNEFDGALAVLAHWRKDRDRWVRKSCGVAVHLWAKRTHGDPRRLPKAKKLLAFLGPLFGEQDVDAVKGIGWALKTLGRYYPDVLAPWLAARVSRARSFRPLMLRKATTYLPSKDRNNAYMAASR
jgi:3-methyladenine DNA glycosylase AlkD